MKERIRGNLSLRLYCCSKLEEPSAYHFLDLFRRIGGDVVHFGSEEPYENPHELIDSEGNIMVVAVRQKLLSAYTPNEPSMAFIGSSNYVSFSKDISHREVEKVDAVAHSFLEFAQILYPSLGPAYGCIDEVGTNLPGIKDVQDGKLDKLMWANLFGPSYVEAYGEEFLLGAPGWKTEILSDGGILYVLSHSFVNRWETVKAQEVRAYFQQKIPNIRIYRPYKRGYFD